jgi:hypothetical protein
MRSILASGAAALLLAAAAPALAQTAHSATGQASSAATGAAAPTAATASAAAPTLAVGQPVKDKTGVVVGQITELKPAGASQTATVKMGEQSFAIGAESFVVQDGAAVLNATQAELKAMIAQAAKAG